MKKFGGLKLIIAMATGFLLISACSSTSKVAKNTTNIRLMAKDAYLYGYPLVLTDITKAKAPINKFAHFKTFPEALSSAGSRPNTDTLYSTAWLDLNTEPQIVTLPPTGDRYFSASMMDAWTNVFFAPGIRTTDNQMQNVAVVGPGWKGYVPEGVEVVQAPTHIVWVVGKVAVKNRNDFKGAHYIQDRLLVTPLSRWGKPYRTAAVKAKANFDRRSSPQEQILTMSAEEYFKRLAELMKTNPPLPGDGRILRDLAQLGIVPGESFDPNKLTPEARVALSDGALEGNAAVTSGAKNLMGDLTENWGYLRNQGRLGKDYETRAFMAHAGLTANLDEDILVAQTSVDSMGQPLNGTNLYVLRFTKDNLPPVNGFWSLTLYNPQRGFAKNALRRYSINSSQNLVYNEDGSLNIYIQNRSPGKSLEANWLPAPKAEFNLVGRLYWPKENALKGNWRWPAIQRGEAPLPMQKALWIYQAQ